MSGLDLAIQSASALVAAKRQLVQGLGMTNASVDEASRMQQSMRLSQAQSDLWNAQDALRALIAQREAASR